MKNTLKHLSADEISEKKATLKENYSQMHKLLDKLKYVNDINEEDKREYYQVLASIRYEKWNLRQGISKRNLRRLFDGLWRAAVLDEKIEIRDSRTDAILDVYELRDRKDLAWEEFLVKNPEYR